MRRQAKLLLSLSLLFLAGGGLVFAAEQAKSQIELTLSRFLQLPVRIHRITLLPGELVLHRVRLQVADASQAKPPFAIERLQIEVPYLWTLVIPSFGKKQRLLELFSKGAGSITVKEFRLTLGGFPLRGHGRLDLTSGPGGDLRAEGGLSFLHPLVKGRVEITGSAAAPVLIGWLETSRFGRKNFAAQLIFSSDSMELSRIEIQGGWNAAGRFSASPTSGNSVLLWVYREELEPQRFTVEWSVARPWLKFQMQMMGAEAALAGRIHLQSPYPVEMALEVNALDLKNWIEWLNPDLGGARLSGRVWGKVAFTGPLPELNSQGELRAEGGQFNRQPVRSVVLRFQGKGPILKIDNSQLVWTETASVVEGTVDLRKLGQPDFFAAVRVTSADGDLRVAGWRVSSKF